MQKTKYFKNLSNRKSEKMYTLSTLLIVRIIMKHFCIVQTLHVIIAY